MPETSTQQGPENQRDAYDEMTFDQLIKAMEANSKLQRNAAVVKLQGESKGADIAKKMLRHFDKEMGERKALQEQTRKADEAAMKIALNQQRAEKDLQKAIGLIVGKEITPLGSHKDEPQDGNSSLTDSHYGVV